MSGEYPQQNDAERVLRALATMQPPEGMQERLLRRVRAAEAQRIQPGGTRWNGWMWPMMAAVAVALVAVSGLEWMQTGPRAARPDAVARAVPVVGMRQEAATADGLAARPEAVVRAGRRPLHVAASAPLRRAPVPMRVASVRPAETADGQPWDQFASDESSLAEMKASTPGQALPVFETAGAPGQMLPKLEASVPGRPLPAFDMARVPGEPLRSFRNAMNTGDQP